MNAKKKIFKNTTVISDLMLTHTHSEISHFHKLANEISSSSRQASGDQVPSAHFSLLSPLPVRREKHSRDNYLSAEEKDGDGK